MTALPHCPKCQSAYTYEDRGFTSALNAGTNGQR